MPKFVIAHFYLFLQIIKDAIDLTALLYTHRCYSVIKVRQASKRPKPQ